MVAQSIDRTAQNGRNARHSTGPKSPAGKAITRYNARKHGLLSSAPVVSGLERPEDWQRHLQATCESLAPDGHLEMVLCERIALLLWRMARLTRVEQESIHHAQQGVDAAIHERRYRDNRISPSGNPFASTWPEDIREDAEDAAHRLELFRALSSMAPDSPMSAEDANTMLNILYDAAAPEEGEDVPIPGAPPQGADESLEDYCARVAWSGALLRAALGAFAAHADAQPELLLARIIDDLGYKARTSALVRERMELEVRNMQSERLIPDDDTLQKISRYEAHLERSLLRMLHELERLQARRQGKLVPPAAALDVTGVSDS
jgi:hypothetical protein